ncbi:unnamed protein product [Cylicocyclus nassatus]|uniref:Uncharacterized protein n=1 Tax=Cylicocyclus nassatus TaxID=53992 RepID=A0AA36GEJ5_CYLNA|nr:unnamed protein product [Cylicocyclus nassatus]
MHQNFFAGFNATNEMKLLLLLLLLVSLAMCGLVVSVLKQANPGKTKRRGFKKWKYICSTSEDKDGLEKKFCEKVDRYKYKGGYETLAICQERCLGYLQF